MKSCWCSLNPTCRCINFSQIFPYFFILFFQLYYHCVDEGKAKQASLQPIVQDVQQRAKLHRHLLPSGIALPLKILQVQPLRLLPRPAHQRRGRPPPQTHQEQATQTTHLRNLPHSQTHFPPLVLATHQSLLQHGAQLTRTQLQVPLQQRGSSLRARHPGEGTGDGAGEDAG